MKKIIAVILCAVMLLGCTAFAEESAEKELMGTLKVHNSFSIRCKLPEGYEQTVVESDDVHIVASIDSRDAADPALVVNIAFNEEYTLEDGTGLKLNDVDEETLADIKDSFIEDGDMTDAVFEEKETAYGTKVLIVRGRVSGRDIIVFYSIYQSYEVEVVAIPGAEAPDSLSAEQVDMVIDFLSEMDFDAA